LQEILTAIATVGFPIVACIALFYYIYKQAERHKDEINTLTTALNNNTIVLSKLSEKIDVLTQIRRDEQNEKRSD
jgi:hypothetical protein